MFDANGTFLIAHPEDLLIVTCFYNQFILAIIYSRRLLSRLCSGSCIRFSKYHLVFGSFVITTLRGQNPRRRAQADVSWLYRVSNGKNIQCGGCAGSYSYAPMSYPTPCGLDTPE